MFTLAGLKLLTLGQQEMLPILRDGTTLAPGSHHSAIHGTLGKASIIKKKMNWNCPIGMVVGSPEGSFQKKNKKK